MTLRLTDKETDDLRAFAAATGRSMQDVARQAIRDFVHQRDELRRDLLARIVAEDAPLLDLLAK